MMLRNPITLVLSFILRKLLRKPILSDSLLANDGEKLRRDYCR